MGEGVREEKKTNHLFQIIGKKKDPKRLKRRWGPRFLINSAASKDAAETTLEKN